MKKIFAPLVVSVVLLGTTGTAATSPTTMTTGSATGAGFKQDMAEFRMEMSAKLESAETQIAALKEKSKMKGSSIKQATITDLEKTRDKIKTDLDALDKSTESSWRNLKTKIAQAMDNLNTKAQRLLQE